MEITLEQAFGGTEATVRVPSSVSCEACHGSGAEAGSKPGAMPDLPRSRPYAPSRASSPSSALPRLPWRGPGDRQAVPDLLLEPGSRAPREDAQGQHPGWRRGTARASGLTGEGGAGVRGGPAGDLYLPVGAPPSPLQREGADIHCRVPISMVHGDARQQHRSMCPTLDGKMARVNIPCRRSGRPPVPPARQGHAIMRLTQHGDMYIGRSTSRRRPITGQAEGTVKGVRRPARPPKASSARSRRCSAGRPNTLIHSPPRPGGAREPEDSGEMLRIRRRSRNLYCDFLRPLARHLPREEHEFFGGTPPPSRTLPDGLPARRPGSGGRTGSSIERNGSAARPKLQGGWWYLQRGRAARPDRLRRWPRMPSCTVEAEQATAVGCCGRRPSARPAPARRSCRRTRRSSRRPDRDPMSWVTKITPRSNSRCSSRISSRTWICTVASSAVVGSSASSRLGLHDRRARSWRVGACRPTSRADRFLRRCAGEGMRTSSSSRARFQCVGRALPVCLRIVSVICWPMVKTGSKAVAGSWKIMATRRRAGRPAPAAPCRAPRRLLERCRPTSACDARDAAAGSSAG